MIVVSGATGTVGGAVVTELLARGADFRAMVRDPAKAQVKLETQAKLGAHAKLGSQLKLVRGDYTDPASLEGAFAGAKTLFLLTPPGPDTVPQTVQAVQAAQRAGLEHIVKLSALGAAPEAPIQLGRWHAAAEEAVRESGLGWTVLQPGSFMQNFLHSAESIRGNGEFYAARGQGKQALIDARDIAAAAAIVSMDPAGHAGLTHQVTGGEAVSDADVAAALSDATGRPVRYVEVPPEAVAAGMRSAGLPDYLVDDLLFLDGLVAQGHLDAVLPGLEVLLGRAPRTIADFARDYAAAFKG